MLSPIQPQDCVDSRPVYQIDPRMGWVMMNPPASPALILSQEGNTSSPFPRQAPEHWPCAQPG